MMNRANRLYIKRVSVLSRQICICCTWLLVGLIYNKRKLSSPNTYQHARTEDCIVDTKQTAVQKGVKGRQTCRRIADKKKKKSENPKSNHVIFYIHMYILYIHRWNIYIYMYIYFLSAWYQ